MFCLYFICCKVYKFQQNLSQNLSENLFVYIIKKLSLNYFYYHTIQFFRFQFKQYSFSINIIFFIQSMKFIFFLLFSLLFSANSMITYDSSINYVSNPDFSIPKLSNFSFTVVATAGAWSETSNQIEIGDVKRYTPKFDSGQLCELDAGHNSNLYQSINLEVGYYQLNITWAAKYAFPGETNYLPFESSKWSVYWNDVFVQLFTPTDYEIHKEALILKAIQGTNKLSLRGEGTSDAGGALIKFVQLYAQNNIQNGNFETPSTRKGWRILKSAGQWSSYTNQIKIGQGTIFNSVWTTGQVAELDANKNSQIYQIISIPAGKYHLRFDWGARINVPLRSNSFSVWWNNIRLTLQKPPDYNIHTFTVDVQASQGNNTISLKGEGISDGYGVGIDNVKLWRAV